MKTLKLIFPLTVALAVSLLGSGCKHQPAKLTNLPNSPEATVGDNPPITTTPGQQTPPTPVQQPPTTLPPTTTTPQQLPPANQFPVENNGGVTASNTPTPFLPGELATSENWNPTDYVADRAALAAYTVHFAFDSAVVKSGEEDNVKAVAAALTKDPSVKLMIEGNCDERGTEEYNRSLGERRALALREALVKLNIDAKRIRTISYGKDKPVDTERNEAAYAKNRRGDFVLYHPKTGV
jgi:peptidoglycan-associated lipoprotein